MKSNTPREMGATPLAEILGNKPDYQKQINKVKSVYESLELGMFTDAILSEIINSGTDDILSGYKTQVTKEIEGSGIKSVRMKDLLLQSYNYAVADFNNALAGLIDAVEAKRKELASQKILSAALEYQASGFEKTYGFSNDPDNTFKRLIVGANSWISTTNGKSWGFEYSTVIMHPNKGDIYLYASCPANNGPAKLLASYEPMPNTPTDYLVLINKYEYRDIDFS